MSVYNYCQIENGVVIRYVGVQSHVIIPTTNEIELESLFSFDEEKVEVFDIVGIGDAAFRGKHSIRCVTISEGLISIGNEAFSSCVNLEHVIIPRSITEISDNAFEGSPKVTIVADEGGYAAEYARKKGIPLLTSRFVTENGVLKQYIGSNSHIVIPDDGSVIEIGERAFKNFNSLDRIVIPHTVKKIGEGAFYGCYGLRGICIPSTVEEIGKDAFAYCSGLTSIVVEDGNPKYHSKSNCLIETESGCMILGCSNSIIPKDGSVRAIGASIIYYDYAIALTIPSSVTEINSFAFSNCPHLIILADADSFAEEYANMHGIRVAIDGIIVRDGYLTLIMEDIAYGQEGVDEEADKTQAAKRITIPASVKIISPEVFPLLSKYSSIVVDEYNPVFHSSGNCVINTESGLLILGTNTSVIPDDGTVKAISSEAFSKCELLEDLSIPSSVTEIDRESFVGCRSLKRIKIPSSVVKMGYNIFDNNNNELVIVAEEASCAAKYAHIYGIKLELI